MHYYSVALAVLNMLKRICISIMGKGFVDPRWACLHINLYAHDNKLAYSIYQLSLSLNAQQIHVSMAKCAIIVSPIFSMIWRFDGIWSRNQASFTAICSVESISLQWRRNGRKSVSKSPASRLFSNRLIRRRPKKTSKLRITGLCAGNSPGNGEFPAQMASTRKMFPFDDVIMIKFCRRCNKTWLLGKLILYRENGCNSENSRGNASHFYWVWIA